MLKKFLLLLLWFSTSAYARDLNTNADLRWFLTLDPEKEPVKVMFAAGYLRGWYEALDGLLVCPKGANPTLGTLATVVIEHMDKNSVRVEADARGTIINALSNRWPCHKKQ